MRDLTLPADDPFGTSLADINLTVRAGEIVGIAGVSGNGQKELMAALSGERTLASADTVTLLGTPAGRLDAAQRRALGFAFVPEERLGRGAVPEMSLADNALLTAYRQGMVARGFVRADVVRAVRGRDDPRVRRQGRRARTPRRAASPAATCRSSSSAARSASSRR